MGWETNNQYVVKNSLGQQAWLAVEESDFCTRTVCGSMRSFVIRLQDNAGQEVLTLARPLKCTSCWFPCCLQEVRVPVKLKKLKLLDHLLKEFSCVCVLLEAWGSPRRPFFFHTLLLLNREPPFRMWRWLEPKVCSYIWSTFVSFSWRSRPLVAPPWGLWRRTGTRTSPSSPSGTRESERCCGSSGLSATGTAARTWCLRLRVQNVNRQVTVAH